MTGFSFPDSCMFKKVEEIVFVPEQRADMVHLGFLLDSAGQLMSCKEHIPASKLEQKLDH